MAVLPLSTQAEALQIPETQKLLPGAELDFPTGPQTFSNTPQGINQRRAFTIDNFERLQAQYQVDHGVYQRPAVGPVEYAESNIKKSNQPVGVAGYQHRALPMPDSADDLTQAQYFAGLTNATPEKRLKFAEALANTNQYFLNTPDQSALMLGSSHNMANNLLALASQKKGHNK
jgi:hypothetical protein